MGKHGHNGHGPNGRPSQQQKYNFSPDRIYKCNETGKITVPNKPSKVISARGKKQVGSLSSAERGQLVTVEIRISTSGNFISPFFIFPRRSELV